MKAATEYNNNIPTLISLTDRAAERLRDLYSLSENETYLRISVSSKGCSGNSYDLKFVDDMCDNDEVIRDKGITLLIDRKAILFLIGSVMDYKVETFSSGFIFNNPNEKARCGCGESFTI